MQPESRLLTARENQPQSCGEPSDEQVQPRERLGRIKLMEIVNDQNERFAQRIEVGEQPLDHRLTAKPRCRLNAFDQLFSPRRIGKAVDDRQPEVLRILLPAVDPHPGDALAEILGLDPRSQQFGLAASGGGADEDHATAGCG
jgi:hypothetical protein